jgi:hypothetical protein
MPNSALQPPYDVPAGVTAAPIDVVSLQAARQFVGTSRSPRDAPADVGRVVRRVGSGADDD